jgi:hypothetical protein
VTAHSSISALSLPLDDREIANIAVRQRRSLPRQPPQTHLLLREKYRGDDGGDEQRLDDHERPWSSATAEQRIPAMRWCEQPPLLRTSLMKDRGLSRHPRVRTLLEIRSDQRNAAAGDASAR